MKSIIDDNVKSYLVACLVTGVDVTEDKNILMPKLVEHMNTTERVYWAQGDEDGIIVHDKNDMPLLYLMYNGKRMTFRAFEQDEFDAMNTQKEIGLALLNILGFFQIEGLEYGPSVLGSESRVVANINNTQNNTDPNDWAI